VSKRGSDEAAQLPLALRFPPDQRFDTFVGAPAGAIALLRALARSEPAVASVYLSGAQGTGKTHLLLAACAEAESAGLRAAYLPLAAARGRVREALEAYDSADLLAIDGVDAIADDQAGGRGDEIALFDAHNRSHDAGRRLLYSASAAPDALALTLPDLRSRLSQCARVALDPLDDAGRAEVLRLRALRRGLQMDDAAIDWLLKRVDRDLGSLTALLDRLDRESLAAQRRLTVPFLRSVLG
jgi:DnaA-homolog protein